MRMPDGCWRVHFERGSASRYDALFIATGDRRRSSAGTRTDLLIPESLLFFDPEEREALRDELPLWMHLIHPDYRIWTPSSSTKTPASWSAGWTIRPSST